MTGADGEVLTLSFAQTGGDGVYLAMDNHGAAERHLARAIELGHAPTQDFVKAMEKAQMKKARNENTTLVEITGAEGPGKKREE